MASARLERTTVELNDGAGRAVLRATGQVTLFPGYLALYEEGRDEKDDEESARMAASCQGVKEESRVTASVSYSCE